MSVFNNAFESHIISNMIDGKDAFWIEKYFLGSERKKGLTAFFVSEIDKKVIFKKISTF